MCGRGVGANSIKCNSCIAWIHKNSSGVLGRLQDVADFRCAKCVGSVNPIPIQAETTKVVEIGVNEKLELVEKFDHLGDMIGAKGGVKDASRAWIRCA